MRISVVADAGSGKATLGRMLIITIALGGPACSNSSGHGLSDKVEQSDHSAMSAGAASGAGGASGIGGASGAVSAKSESDAGAGGATNISAGAGGATHAGGSGGVGPMATSGAGASGDESDAGGVAGTEAMPEPGPSCLDGITELAKAGPFQFEAKVAGSVKLWIPTVPPGCKVPVVHFSNGTGATCSSYEGILERLASHGFIAACFENPNTGDGTGCITAVETAFTMLPDLADHKIGSMAHGGAAAFTCVQLAEEKWGHSTIYTGLAMQPESGNGAVSDWKAAYAKITSPMFMFSGLGTDGLVSQSWVQQSFDALNDADEAYFWTNDGLRFIPVPVAEANQVAIAWFRWKLLGDQKACEFFKALPTTDTRWVEAASQNAQPCM